MGPILTSIVAVLAVCSGLADAQSSTSINIPGQTFIGPSQSQLVSGRTGLEAPKISNLNSTSFEWWYFDAVASDLSAQIALIFFTADVTGLWPGLPKFDSAAWFGALFTFPNGTSSAIFVPADSLTVTTVGDGSSGTFRGLNGGWTGTPDLSEYVVTINEPGAGIQGTLTLQSIAPAHLPCSANIDVPGQTLAISPDLGWINAVPDAHGVANFIINGEPLQFSGLGYHDMNWGTKPVDALVQSLYWGHARAGPYSIVWFDERTPDGVEHVSSYIARSGKVITAACSGVRVRPTGANAPYPPTPENFNDLPDGFHIDFSIPGEGDFVFDITNVLMTVLIPGIEGRWIGTISGGPVNDNSTRWEGAALYEQFTFDV